MTGEIRDEPCGSSPTSPEVEQDEFPAQIDNAEGFTSGVDPVQGVGELGGSYLRRLHSPCGRGVTVQPRTVYWITLRSRYARWMPRVS